MKIKKHITALATAAALSATLPAVAQQSQHMTPETMLSLARVGASALSPDGKTVVYSVGFPSIKDNKIRTELFTISSDGSARRQITQGVAGVHGSLDPAGPSYQLHLLGEWRSSGLDDGSRWHRPQAGDSHRRRPL